MATRFQDGQLEVTDTELVTPRGRWSLEGLEEARVDAPPPARATLWIRFVVAGAAALVGAIVLAEGTLDRAGFGLLGAGLVWLGLRARRAKPVHFCVLKFPGREVRVAQSSDRARLERVVAALHGARR